MKGKLLLIAVHLVMSSATCIHAQTFSEWFSQNRTQRRYLTQQVAALQVYIGYARQGYDIAQKGLSTIGSIKNGDFNLHHDFFTSLKRVNPRIRGYSRVAEIIALQARVIATYRKDLGHMKAESGLQPHEVKYSETVYARLLEDCGQLVDELMAVATDGRLELADDERMKRIDQLYIEMLDRYAFTRNFGKQALMLGILRLRDEMDIRFLNELQPLSKKEE